MQITAYKTRKITVGESIVDILNMYLPPLTENTIAVVASKIISLCEKHVLPLDSTISKFALIKKEADKIFADAQNQHGFYLTLKNHRLIPNAGIDESNAQNVYVLYPQNPQNSAKQIWEFLRTRDGIKNLGVLITDSNVAPLRQGVTGIGIGWCGFQPIYNYIGTNDIFDRPLQVTTINLLDSLATAATLVMGEGNEQTPLASIKNAPKINFQNRAPLPEEEKQVGISLDKDLFAPILKTLGTR